VQFSEMRHPRQLGPSDVTRFLSSLAVERRVSASTQNQALSALVFLCRRRDRGAAALVVGLLYGTGMRLLEALRLRVKDVDFARNEITVRGGKGDRDRVTMVPSG